MNRHELTDEQWARLGPLLPPERPATGRPNHDHRRMLNAILWRYATGAPWRDLPVQYGPWESVYRRFRRWQRAGIWDRLLAGLQAEAAADGRLDWSLHFVDGSVVRAHQHAAGAKKGAAAPLRQRPTRRSAGVAAASAPNSTPALSAAVSR
jgi:transposase